MATEKIFGPIVSLVKTDSYILNLRIIKILFLLYEDNLFNWNNIRQKMRL
jgi:hypothetical protein